MAHNADNHYRTDEVDLRELAQALWESKILIVIVTLCATGIAAAYAFFATPIYQATVQTLPPTASGLTSYNVASQLTGNAIRGTVLNATVGIEPLTPQEAYKVFLRQLNSSTIRQNFFDQYYLPAQGDNKTEGEKQRAWKRLNKDLTISLPTRTGEYEARISLEGQNPQTIANWANAYVNLAIEAASEELLSGLSGEVKIRHQSLNDQIAAARKVAEVVRKDRIIRLKGSLAVAEAIGLETPLSDTTLVAINTEGLNTESVDSGSLLYLRGAKALRSELQQLEQRETNDAYIAELPDLLKKKALLESINLNPDLLSVATIDRAAIAPEDPVKPKKQLIVLLGIVLGMGLSILIVLGRHVLRRSA